jgi:hypothetical protein
LFYSFKKVCKIIKIGCMSKFEAVNHLIQGKPDRSDISKCPTLPFALNTLSASGGTHVSKLNVILQQAYVREYEVGNASVAIKRWGNRPKTGGRPAYFFQVSKIHSRIAIKRKPEIWERYAKLPISNRTTNTRQKTGLQNSIARQHDDIRSIRAQCPPFTYPVHNNFVENDSSSMVQQCDSASTAEVTEIEKSSILRARRHKIQQVVLSKNRRLPNPLAFKMTQSR